MKRLTWVILPILFLVPVFRHHTGPPLHRAVLARYGPIAYTGPSVDDQIDQLDTDRAEAARTALEAAQAAEEARVAAEAQKTVQAPLRPSPVIPTGGHSDLWWRAVAVHEEGGFNDAFFGFFGIISGEAGGLPWDTQVAIANRIIASYGDGAWAASSVAAGYAASPSG